MQFQWNIYLLEFLSWIIKRPVTKLLLILLFILCNLSNSDDGLDFYLVNNYTRATTSRMRDEARRMGNNVISPFCREIWVSTTIICWSRSHHLGLVCLISNERLDTDEYSRIRIKYKREWFCGISDFWGIFLINIWRLKATKL